MERLYSGLWGTKKGNSLKRFRHIDTDNNNMEYDQLKIRKIVSLSLLPEAANKWNEKYSFCKAIFLGNVNLEMLKHLDKLCFDVEDLDILIIFENTFCRNQENLSPLCAF